MIVFAFPTQIVNGLYVSDNLFYREVENISMSIDSKLDINSYMQKLV